MFHFWSLYDVVYSILIGFLLHQYLYYYVYYCAVYVADNEFEVIMPDWVQTGLTMTQHCVSYTGQIIGLVLITDLNHDRKIFLTKNYVI